MTAEIAVMNKRAVALAADSAVTSSPIGKIYTTANKLFALSKYNPVGIMIYGNAFFMDIPWETVIKNYRKHLGEKEFSTVKGYCGDLIRYLRGNRLRITEKRQLNFIEHILNNLFNEIRQKSQDKFFHEIVIEKRNISQDDLPKFIIDILKDVINEYYQNFKKANINDYWQKEGVARKKKKLNALIRKKVKERFNVQELGKDHQERVYKIAEAVLFGDNYFEDTSSVVLTGFGKAQIFPALYTLKISFVFGDYLKYRYEEEKSADFNQDGVYSAQIFPFAQTDVIEHFLYGIDMQLRRISDRIFYKILIKIREEIEKSLSEKYGLDEKEISDQIDSIIKNRIPDAAKQIDKYIFENYYSKIIQTVGALQINELGEMAETLVNLTSFKRRVTSNIEETVSGPIDVAVISKGDGFIWLKRKHYFKPELNHHFFSNYFKEAKYGKT